MGIFSIVMLRKHPFLQDCILFDINSHSSSDDFIHLFRWDSRAGTLVSKHLRCEDRAFFDVAGGDDRTSGVGAGRCLGVQTFQIIAASQGVDECNPLQDISCIIRVHRVIVVVALQCFVQCKMLLYDDSSKIICSFDHIGAGIRLRMIRIANEDWRTIFISVNWIFCVAFFQGSDLVQVCMFVRCRIFQHAVKQRD